MSEIIDLSGQVALVTGSSRGIGLSIAEKFAGAGADVVINSRHASDKLEKLALDIAKRHKVRCIAIAADVGNAQEVNALFQDIFKHFKKLDVLVNNAGVLKDSLIGMIRQEDISQTFSVNVTGTLNAIQTGTRLLQRSKNGCIINIASIIGTRGNSGQLVYGASKGAIISATLSAAKELAAKQIRVNAIAPGYIETDMIKHIPLETHKERLASIGMGRIGTPEDIANVALFLASPLASYVTGTVIGVDGGMLI